jgi:hypothetical protein
VRARMLCTDGEPGAKGSDGNSKARPSAAKALSIEMSYGTAEAVP